MDPIDKHMDCRQSSQVAGGVDGIKQDWMGEDREDSGRVTTEEVKEQYQ